MRLILVRHGETQWNKEDRILADGVPMNPRGVEQARAISGTLARERPFALYASPLARAREATQIISDSLDIPFVHLEGLREADMGELVGLTVSEVRQRYPDFYNLWDADPGTAKIPGGESLVQVQDRAWQEVSSLLGRHEDDTVVAVTHHFTIHTIVCRVLEVPLSHLTRMTVDLGSITQLEFSSSAGVLTSFNETGHLRSGSPPAGVGDLGHE